VGTSAGRALKPTANTNLVWVGAGDGPTLCTPAPMKTHLNDVIDELVKPRRRMPKWSAFCMKHPQTDGRGARDNFRRTRLETRSTWPPKWNPTGHAETAAAH